MTMKLQNEIIDALNSLEEEVIIGLDRMVDEEFEKADNTTSETQKSHRQGKAIGLMEAILFIMALRVSRENLEKGGLY